MKHPMTPTMHKRMLGRYLFGDKRLKKREVNPKEHIRDIDVRKSWEGVSWVNYV